mmetsp:Transcript_5144/g.18219  ORF Transcript_5144/g.18219 Transcript_5144/m.18219 type:complete len:80 (+) Transcript_5144:702-941(+)
MVAQDGPVSSTILSRQRVLSTKESFRQKSLFDKRAACPRSRSRPSRVEDWMWAQLRSLGRSSCTLPLAEALELEGDGLS